MTVTALTRQVFTIWLRSASIARVRETCFVASASKWFALALLAVAITSCGVPARPADARIAPLDATWQPGPPADLPVGARLFEEQRFQGPDGAELWRLYWTSEPRSRCVSDLELSARANCACEGFANGLSGPMVLTRMRKNHQTEYLNIGGLFSDSVEQQLGGDALIAGARAAEPTGAPGATESASRSAGLRVLQLGDYNRDGIAAEFVLHTANEACGHGRYLLVGLLARDGALAAQTDLAQDRTQPIALDAAADWEVLRATGRLQREYWRCFDQGSEVSKRIRASAAAGLVEVAREERDCRSAGPSF